MLISLLCFTLALAQEPETTATEAASKAEATATDASTEAATTGAAAAAGSAAAAKGGATEAASSATEAASSATEAASSVPVDAVGPDHADIVKDAEDATKVPTQTAVETAEIQAAATAASAPAPAPACECSPPEPEPKPPGSLTAELGGAWATGNTEILSINGRILGIYDKNNNKFTGDAGFLYGIAKQDEDGDGTLSEAERDAGYNTNAQRVGVLLRYDRSFGRNGVYVAADFLHDPFAGLDYRFGQSVGYRRVLVDSKVVTFGLDAGLVTAQEFYTEDVILDPPGPNTNYQFIFGAMGGLDLAIRFNELIRFTNNIDVFGNFLGTNFSENDNSDIRLRNDAALHIALSKRFGLKLSHLLRYKSLPVSDFRHVDMTMTLALVANIF